jgi:CCR4-NOT transcription complex subunit 7/8
MESNRNNVNLEQEETIEEIFDISTDSNSESLQKSCNSEKEYIDDKSSNSRNSSVIKEVYSENLEEEMKVIISLLKEYNYIGMDTEFPGTVYSLKNLSDDFYYKTLQKNVNELKLIQLGITLTNKDGEYPKNIPYHTWQFNFKFDEKKDKYSEESLNLLKSTGIDFDKLKKNGIDHKKFGKILKRTGLVLNPDVKWISFHGSYDFAYLLKILDKESLSSNENKFIYSLGIYFPHYYDIRVLIKDIDLYFHGGLNKLISTLKIQRKGIKHQAGSDSIATIEAFHKLIKNGSITKLKMKKLDKVLYGIGKGRDNENTIKYMKNANNSDKNKNLKNFNENNNINQSNLSNNNNMMNMQNQKMNMNNYIKCFYPMYYINACRMMNNNILLNQMRLCQTMMA